MNEVSIIINGVRYDLEIPSRPLSHRCHYCELRKKCAMMKNSYNQTICEKFQCIIGFFKKSDKKFER